MITDYGKGRVLNDKLQWESSSILYIGYDPTLLGINGKGPIDYSECRAMWLSSHGQSLRI